MRAVQAGVEHPAEGLVERGESRDGAAGDAFGACLEGGVGVGLPLAEELPERKEPRRPVAGAGLSAGINGAPGGGRW